MVTLRLTYETEAGCVALSRHAARSQIYVADKSLLSLPLSSTQLSIL